MKLKLTITVVVLAAFGLFAGLALADHGPAGSHLVAVGPVSQDHGFPVWYKDATGLTLELCLDHQNPLCNFLPGDVPDPNNPISFPGNFPEEAFWFMGDALLDTGGGGGAGLVLGLEAAFAGGGPVPGDQITFGRVRIRADINVAGDYTVTHPYGQDVFTGVPTGPNGINMTEDIGIGAFGDYSGALNSRIGPFLVWDNTPPAPPPGFVSDPLIDHPVTGSPFGTNFFRIEGPVGAFTGSTNLCADPTLGDSPTATTDCIETDLFSIMGKIAAIAGVEVTGATYQTAGSGGSVNVFALSEAGQAIHASGSGLNTTPLAGNSTGLYFSRLDFAGAPPASVTVTNVGDVPPSVATVNLVDQVIISRAEYDNDTGALTVDATSSDVVNAPALEAFLADGVTSLGTLTGGTLTVNGVIPTASIIVKSAAGGQDSQPVEVIGAGSDPLTVLAIAGPPQSVVQGASVLLDGSSSVGATGFNWTQISGPTGIAGLPAAAPTFNFTAPAIPGLYEFELEVTGPGPGSPSTDVVAVTVQASAPPVADAGPDQSAVQGATVQLDGSNSTGALTYSWLQMSGAAATLSDPNVAAPTFTFPNVADTLVFSLTVTGPGGSDEDTVAVSSVNDVLTVLRARFRTGRSEWRVEGTSSILTGNKVTIYLGPTVGGTVLAADLDVDALGDWRFRDKNSGTPAAPNQTISIQSSAGGVLENVPVAVN